MFTLTLTLTLCTLTLWYAKVPHWLANPSLCSEDEDEVEMSSNSDEHDPEPEPLPSKHSPSLLDEVDREDPEEDKVRT